MLFNLLNFFMFGPDSKLGEQLIITDMGSDLMLISSENMRIQKDKIVEAGFRLHAELS